MGRKSDGKFKRRKGSQRIHTCSRAPMDLEGVRRELIAGYSKQLCGYGKIGIKRVGEIDVKPFLDACKKRFPIEREARSKAVQLWSIWQKRLRDPDFHPINVVMFRQQPQAVMKTDDVSMYLLKVEWGDAICDAVVSAYRDMILQNSSGRREVVSELWNYKRNRKATLTEATKHIIGDEKEGRRQDIDELRKLLAEKDEQIEYLERNNQVLTVKECQSNKEIQELRKKLLNGFPQRGSGDIKVREMGRLDFEPFKEAFKNLPGALADYKSVKLYTKWEHKLTDSTWHPLKIIDVDGEPKEVVKEDDETLNDLKNKWGEDIAEAVIRAYIELNEANPSGRYVIKELWNYKEERRATLKEAVKCLVPAAKRQKRSCAK